MRLRQISERIPAGRWGDPNDFAGPVIFLASAASQYVCGELLVVDGVSKKQKYREAVFFPPLADKRVSFLFRDGWAADFFETGIMCVGVHCGGAAIEINVCVRRVLNNGIHIVIRY